jgi:uncharacterized protein YndB with AHSA1/START domain
MAIQAAQVSTDMETSLESAWKALTNTDVLGRAFFGSKVETTWKVGSPIYFRGEWKGKKFEDKGNILTFSPQKQLRFTHWSPLSGLEDKPENYHLVTFDLLPGAKTKVRVTQDNENETPVDDATKQELTKNWTAILDGLKKAAEKTYGRRSD